MDNYQGACSVAACVLAFGKCDNEMYMYVRKTHELLMTFVFGSLSSDLPSGFLVP